MEANANIHHQNLIFGYLNTQNLWIKSTLIWFEKVDNRLIIFLLLAFSWGSFSLQSNEEMYFALAKQYMDPTWIKNSFLFTEFAGTRLVFQWISGFLLKHLSFEQFCLFGRLLNFGLYGIAIGPLFKTLKVSNLATLFIFAFLWRRKQTFFAFEWVFGGFEAKTLAYVFIFGAIYFLLKERWYWATISIVIATYLHILVGGWFFLAFFAFHFIDKKKVLESIKIGAIFSLLIAPWLYYLSKEVLLFEMDGATKAMLDYAYVFERAPHHLGIFMSWQYFSEQALWGFLLSLVGFVLVIWRFKKEEGEYKKLALLLLVIYGMLYLCCLIALSGNPSFLKFYPFRIASLLFLLSTLLLLKPLSDSILSLKFKRWLPGILFILGIIYALDNLKRNVWTMQAKTPEVDELAEFARNNTPKEAVFSFYGLGMYTEKPETSFFRKAERDGWVENKFVPSGGAKLLDWNTRIEEYQKLEADINALDSLKHKYKIDYIVALKPLEKTYLRLVFENQKYKLYQIK